MSLLAPRKSLLSPPKPDPFGPPAPPRTTPPMTSKRVGLLIVSVVALLAIAVSWWQVGFGVVPLVTGLGDMWTFLTSTVPPKFHTESYSFGALMHDAVLTVAMALIGTVMAVILSVPLGFLAARNTTPHPAVRFAARAVITACRAAPELILAIVFRDALGIGVLPGVLALGFHSVGMLGKMYADAIEQTPQGPRDAVAAAGGGRLQDIMAVVMPYASPTILSTALYRLDINLRAAVVLGFVGAGGIGFALQTDLNTLQFQLAMGIVVVTTVMILLMELVSALLRSTLIGDDASPRRANWSDKLLARWRGRPASVMDFDRDRVRPRMTAGRFGRATVPYLAIAAIVAAYIGTGIKAKDLLAAPAQLGHILTLYFPPDFVTAGGAIFAGMGQSMVIAILGTAIGALIALPVSFLAARNIANPVVYRVVRVLLVVGRAIPELIVAIAFVVSVGPGVLAGAFTLIVGTVAFFAKLMADNLEEVPSGPRDAVRSTGAGPFQEVIVGVVPPASPGIIANLLYMLDINFRASAVLGIVGAGGIGFLLFQSVQSYNYRTTGAIILFTFVVVLAIEQLANWIRRTLD